VRSTTSSARVSSAVARSSKQAQAVPDDQPDQGRLDSRVLAHPVAQPAHEERRRRHTSLVDVRLGKDPDAVTLPLPL